MPIRYSIDTNSVHEHIISIKMEFIAEWDNPILELPVWTPGSYKVRDYSKHVHQFEVFKEDNMVEFQKLNKNQWKILVSKGSAVKVTYDLYAYDLTVRTAYLDDRYGLLSPASLFFYIIDDNGRNSKDKIYNLKFNISKDFELFTSLQQRDGTYIAEDYDELVDSPIALAHPDVLELRSYSIEDGQGQNVPCTVALIGHRGNQDIDSFTSQLKKLQHKSIEMFGSLPYNRYLWVLYVVGKGGGGLEHKYSNFSIINRWYFKNDDMKYAKLMSLEAHEHFHAYNIKRIRPSQLGPFEYGKEVYTSLLWVAEGMTSFYDNAFLPRCEIIEQDSYWKVIAKDYSKLQQIPGRFETSLSESSFDAWVKLYQPHEGSVNLYVSYYLKGGLVSMMLDLEIREQTGWQNSLDTFFKSMYQDYLKTGNSFEEVEFKQILETKTNTDLTEFWNKYIDGTVEIPLKEYLTYIGMELKPKDKDNKFPFTGFNLKDNKQNVKSVLVNSPASKAGIYANDKLVAMNSFEINKSTFDDVMNNFEPNERVDVHLIRDGILRKVTMELADHKPEEYEIVPDPNASEEQKRNREKFFHIS